MIVAAVMEWGFWGGSDGDGGVGGATFLDLGFDKGR